MERSYVYVYVFNKHNPSEFTFVSGIFIGNDKEEIEEKL